jgi:hypothetical protein
MPYLNTININLGSSKSNLTLYAAFYDTDGQVLAGKGRITSGFVEFTKGNYLWTYDGFPDNFRGAVAFYNNSNDDFLAMTSVNPEEVERIAYMSGIIDELTNPPKEITVEVPHILTKGTSVDVIADRTMNDKNIQITQSSEHYNSNNVGSIIAGSQNIKQPIQIITGEGS